MAGSISGLSSGLDTAAIISQLMQLEAAPQDRLKTRLGAEEREIGSLRTLNAKIASLFTKAKELSGPSGTSWSPLSATSSSDKMSVTTTSTASPTSLNVTITKVAQAHQIGYGDKAALTDLVTGASNTVKVDFLDPDSTPLELVTDGTLQGLVDAINDPDNATGLRASAVKVEDGKYQLLVESTTSGEVSDFKLTQADGSALLGVATERLGADAEISLGAGITAKSTTNTFTDLVPGVSLTISPDATPPLTTKISVTRNSDAVTSMVKGLVDNLNSVIDDIESLTAYNPTAKSSGILAGNSAIRDIRSTLLDSVIPKDGSTLASLGIETDRSGNIKLDEAKFKAAYLADPAGVAAKLGGTGGFAERLKSVSDAASNSTVGTLTGSITSRQSGLTRLNDSIANWDVRLELREKTLTRQYTALEVALNNMNSQSTWLAGQIAGLSSSSGS